MNIELSAKQFRRLLDMAYIGNWVLNSARGNDRIADFDEVEAKLFKEAMDNGFTALAEQRAGSVGPSRAFCEGGIHEAIMDYEDSFFFEILAEELARRDLHAEGFSSTDPEEVNRRMAEYIAEFEHNGIDNIDVRM